MAKTVTLRIDERSYRIFSNRAKAEKRPLSNYIELAALEHARETAFVDDEEMDEIMFDRTLVKRLRQGSRDAGRMRGRFVG